MLLQKERESVVEYGKKLITSGLTKGTGGNVSVLCREKGLFALSPSGMDYFSIAPEQVAVLDLEGNVVDAPCKPSTEHELHRQLYLHRPDFAAVVHAHTDYATALSCLRQPLPALHYLVALAGDFHRFYTACRIKGEEPRLRDARLKLAAATRTVLKNGMDLLGVTAPEKM